MIIFSHRGYNLPGPISNWGWDDEEGCFLIVGGIMHDDRGFPIAETNLPDTADDAFLRVVREAEPYLVLSLDGHYVGHILTGQVWSFPEWLPVDNVVINPLTRKYRVNP